MNKNVEYEEYLLSKTKNELRLILRSIDKEKQSERYRMVSEFLENYDKNHPEEFIKDSRKRDRLKKRNICLDIRCKLRPIFLLIRWGTIGIALITYFYSSFKKGEFITVREIFADTNGKIGTILFFFMGVFSLTEGINWKLENAFTGYTTANIRSIGMIIIGIMLLIVSIIELNRM